MPKQIRMNHESTNAKVAAEAGEEGSRNRTAQSDALLSRAILLRGVVVGERL
jgi:hypothetical protein